MADANLLSELKRQKTLSGLVLYGRIRCAIKKPDMLGDLVAYPGGEFAIIDVFSLKCTDENYFGSSSNTLYATKGSMVIYINDLSLVGEVVKVGGTSLKYGVKVKQQYTHKTAYDGIIALVFKYDNASGNFTIMPNYVKKLSPTDSDLSHTPFEDIVIKARADAVIEYPVTLDSLMPFEGCVDYEEISLSEEKKSGFVEGNGKIDITKIPLNLTYHLKGKKPSPVVGDVEADIKDMHDKRIEYGKTLTKGISEKKEEQEGAFKEVLLDIKRAFTHNVGNNYDYNIGNSTIKGKVYVNDFITKYVLTKPFTANESEDKFTASELYASCERQKNEIAVDPSMLGMQIDGEPAPMLSTDENTFLVILSVTLGLSLDDLESNFASCNRSSGLNFNLWVFTLLYLPYHAGMMGSSLTVVDCDKIFFGYTRNFVEDGYNEECFEMRNNLLLLKTLEDLDDKNSLIPQHSLSVAKACYPGMGKRFLSQNSFPMKADLVELMKVVCGKDIRLSKEELKALDSIRWYSPERVDMLIESGILNSIEEDNKTYLILEKDMEKEFLIYTTLIKKGNEETGISDDIIAESIDEFESEKGFKLEKLQKEGIQLCKFKAAVLSGCAGSGKTTVSDCITLCLKNGLPKYKIIYGTPTGKACRRLAEVVGGTVKTLHSQFGVFMGGEGYLTDITKKRKKDDAGKTIYILDEMAMCNRDLLYEVCRSLDDTDIIYFLGDCKQLPPIGSGNPFYILMKILPCVELGVSKRAAEGSNINYNTTLINNLSNDVVQELLYDDSSFICEECSDAEIPSVVGKVWKGMMDGSYTGKKFEEDDIQIISGYATPEKSFSSTNLNIPIQRYLRRGDKLLFKNGERLFYKNDRVIHARLNSYGSQRYIEIEPNIFQSVLTLGIMNGELGKIIGVVPAEVCRIEEFSEKSLKEDPLYKDIDEEELQNMLDVREKRKDKIRDDTSFFNSSYYFVKVQVYDTDLKADVIILYPARVHDKLEGLSLGGEDISNLELAYALTTHKMQGSQSKVVILPFGSDCNPEFINRNMINTMVTRSQEVVVMIGDIKGSDSSVNRGRKIASKVECDDFLNWIEKIE